MITVSGLGSGLDIESLVTQLVAAERQPTENRLLRQEASLTSEFSAFGVFKGALSSFQVGLTALNTLSTFDQRIATSSDEDVAVLSASSEAETGSYSLAVTQLSANHSLATVGYTAPTDTVGEGVLTLRFGTTDYTSPDPGPESYNSFTQNPDRGVATITIDSSNNTLEGVRDAINDADIGVAATIVNDGSAYRLLINSEESGAENSIEISVADSGDGNDTDANGLSALAFNASATNVSQTVAAQDAIFSINGLSINSASNTARGVLDGVDIELKGISGAAPVELGVTKDEGSIKKAIETFVEGYNSFVSVANSVTAFDATTRSAAALQGDFSVRSIVGQLRQVIANDVEGFGGPFSTLSAIGVTTNADGTLAIDSADLDAALADNFDEISGLFSAVGFTTDPGVSYLGSTQDTAVGSYAVDITQLDSQGSLTGAATLFPQLIDGNNDNFTVSIDGVSSGNISITQGLYATGAQLATELQARINGDSSLSAAGASVSVAYNGNQFEITSDSSGSGSTVALTAVDTNTASSLGLSVSTGIAGQDVIGTINGLAALSTGNVLTALPGSGADGLRIEVNGGALGARGTVDFSRGISDQLNTLLTNFLQDDGIIDARTDGIEERVDEIGDARDALDRRMETLETSLRARFTVLDTLLSQLQNTSNFLTQQLDSLPQPNSINRN
ncbi:MAG: flagellar filament capping protein FliD [Halioglobus sp.]